MRTQRRGRVRRRKRHVQSGHSAALRPDASRYQLEQQVFPPGRALLAHATWVLDQLGPSR